eukprot:PITA_03414
MKDMGLMHYFLGMEVWQKDGEVFVSQGKYANEILRRFHMEKCKPMQTPLARNWRKEDATSAESSYGSAYQAILEGSEACAEIPQRHISVQIVVQTDRGSEALGLHRCRLGRESIRPEEHFWRNLQPWFRCVSWYNRKQRSVALSSAEAEYMATSQAASEAIWMWKILVGLFGHHLRDCVVKRIMFGHHLRDCVWSPSSTEEQDADILTKALSKCKFEFHKDKIGVTDNPFLVEREC